MGTLHCIWDLLNCVPLGTEIVTASDSARIPHETADAKRFKRWGPKHITAGYIRLYIYIWLYDVICIYMVIIYIYTHTYICVYIYNVYIYIYRYICLHHWKGFIFFPMPMPTSRCFLRFPATEAPQRLVHCSGTCWRFRWDENGAPKVEYSTKKCSKYAMLNNRIESLSKLSNVIKC